MNSAPPQVNSELRHEPNGVRVVSTFVELPVDSNRTYDVICDFEALPHFVKDASECTILERYDLQHLRLRIIQSHSFLLLKLNLALDLDVHQFPNRITMDLISGFGVKQYHGVWSVTRKHAHACTLAFQLRAKLAFPAPPFLVDGIITRATCDTLAQIRDECIRRNVGR